MLTKNSDKLELLEMLSVPKHCRESKEYVLATPNGNVYDYFVELIALNDSTINSWLGELLSKEFNNLDLDIRMLLAKHLVSQSKPILARVYRKVYNDLTTEELPIYMSIREEFPLLYDEVEQR